jgi:Secretion system C-terminal sorting domain
MAQVSLVPIYRDPVVEKQNKSARAATLTALRLPFWDDFSFHLSQKYYANDTMWVSSQSVWVNSGEGINPPSINVATFDGYDSLGKPYSVNDILAKGFADKLTSRSLRLADVPIAYRKDSVFISFFYQFKGNGDAPEAGDNLLLLFKNKKGQWIKAWSTEEETTFNPKKFVQKVISISDTSFFHNDFQFRFQNFGRLSGPYDTWNLDYVYVNFKPFSKNPKVFPDRTIATPLTSLLQPYWSIPVKHFLASKKKIFSPPAFGAYNLLGPSKNSPKDFKWSVTPGTTAKIKNFKNNVEISSSNVALDVPKPVDEVYNLLPFIDTTFLLIKVPKDSLIDPNADLVKIKFSLGVVSNDNNINSVYDPSIFSPIKFTTNDTTSTTFILKDYYAYDDGVAEYGFKLNRKGTQLAYQYDMLTNERDTIIGIDVYFPRFGDNTSQTVQLFVLDTLLDNATDFVYKQSIGVTRNARDVFYRLDIPTGAPVQGMFYIGWELNSDAIIPVGLDRNTDSSDKIFFRTLDKGVWEHYLTLKGSLMIRPVFGNTTKQVITSVEDSKTTKPYPNPTRQSFFLSESAKQIQLYDIAGREIMFEQNDQFDKKEIKITNPTTGLYLVRYFDKKWCTEKIMVLP